MGFFSSLWGKNSENGKNTQNNTPTVQQPRMTEAQRHDAFVQSLRENTANGKYGPVPTQSTARKAAAGDSFGLDGHPDKVEKARFTAPAYARDHLDEVGVAKEHRLFEVSVAAFQSVALQEMLLKLKSSFTFGSIITPRRKRSQEPISKDIGQNVCVSVGRCLQEESPAPSRPA